MDIKIRHQINIPCQSITITLLRNDEIWDSFECSIGIDSLAPEYISTIRSVMKMMKTNYTEEVVYVGS